MDKTLKAFAIGLFYVASSFARPCLAAPTPAPHVPVHFDTQLDILHADVLAQVVGCDVRANDGVLVNGKKPDGDSWELLGVSPAKAKPVLRSFTPLLKAVGGAPLSPPELDFRLKPGYYEHLKLDVGGCSFEEFPLIASDLYGTRHITILAKTAFSTRADSARTSAAETGHLTGIFGHMPLPDLQVVLTNSTTGSAFVARNENDSDFLGNRYLYYFDSVPPGHYSLNVIGFGWTENLGDVDLTRSGVAQRDISPEDLGLPEINRRIYDARAPSGH